VFQLISVYRERAQDTLLIDDFFAQIHSVLKDSHMREIARIRNEHSVEILKLRKNLEDRFS
jgi:hypothetical protein